MFKKCCDKYQIEEYNIIHNPKPLKVSDELMKCIEYLLWYVPNIESVQSVKNRLISLKVYDDLIFNLIIKEMNMNQDDVLIVEEISNELYYYYQNKICISCEKIIITKMNNETKTTALLRHIRNIIAHGNFTLIYDLMVGFDTKRLRNTSLEVATAIIKIKPKSLLKGLNNLHNEITQEKIWKYAFIKEKYQVIEENYITKKLGYDFLIEKDNTKFAVEIKVIKKNLIISNNIKVFISRFVESNINGYVPVLILDRASLTEEAKEYLRYKNIIVLDIKLVDELMSGKDSLMRIYNKKKLEGTY